MAFGATEPKDDLPSLQNEIGQIKDIEWREYLDEALRCLNADAFRGALILTWSAFIYTLRQTIRIIGLEFNEEKWPKDSNLVEICFQKGIIESVNRNRLKHFAELRNDCAHPQNVKVSKDDVKYLMSYILENQKAQQKKFFVYVPVPAAVFKHFFADPNYDIDSLRADKLIGILRDDKKEYLRLIDILLSSYNDPSGFVENQEYHEKVRHHACIIWKALAKKFDSEIKVDVNHKLAEYFLKTETSWHWRQFVFFDVWEHTDESARDDITTYLTYEFHDLVDSGEGTTDDQGMLDTMTQYAVGDLKTKCQELLEAIKTIVAGKSEQV